MARGALRQSVARAPALGPVPGRPGRPALDPDGPARKRALVRRGPLVIGVVLVAALLLVGYLGLSAAAWARTTEVDSTCVEERPNQIPANFVAP